MDTNIEEKTLWLKERLKDSAIFTVIILPIFFLINLGIENILPEKFFLDNQVVRSLMANPSIKFSLGDSYSNAAVFYKMIGFNSNTPHFFESIFTTIIFCAFLLVLIIKNNYIALEKSNIFVLVITCYLFLSYFSVISKDLIIFMLFVVSFSFYQKRFFFLAMMGSILLYGILMRPYWVVLIPLTLLVYRQLKKNNVKRILLIIIVFSILFSIIYVAITGQYVTSIRSDVHSTISSNSSLTNVFPANSRVHDILNIFLIGVNLLIPINGITSPLTFVYYGWTYYVIYLCFKVYKDGTPKKNNLIEFRDNNFIISLFISFVVVQSIFEPDLGSALRHQLVISLFIANVFNNKRVLGKLDLIN